MQVTRHVESAPQDTLLLSPTVAVQLAFDPQSMLHDEPHVPPQLADSEQRNEQLFAFSQAPNEHVAPDAQLQLVPVHAAGGGPLGESSLHAPARLTTNRATMRRIRKAGTPWSHRTASPAPRGTNSPSRK